MGLRDEITEELSAAFDSDLADVVSNFTGIRTTTVGGTYDPVTDSYPSTPTPYSGRGKFGDFSAYHIDNINVLHSDKKLFVLLSEVTLEPAVGDVIDGQYDVVSVKTDATGATAKLQLRLRHGS